MTSTKVLAGKFLVFTAIALTLLVLLYNTMVDPVAQDTDEYHAVFTEVSGLRTGDDVRVAGVKVGRVEDIGVLGDTAEVTFSVDVANPPTSTTGLVLRYQNLIGQRYLALVPGGPADPLRPGSTIPVSRTSPGFDLTALLNGFRPLFQVLKPADINTLSESLIKVLQGEGGTVAGLLRETTRLTNYLADRDDLFHQVAANLTPVLQEVAGNGEALAATVSDLAKLTSGLAADRHTMVGALDSLGMLLGKTDALVSRLRRPLQRDMRTLRAVVRMYAANSDAYGRSFAHFGDLLGTLGRTVSYRSAINTLMCDLTLHAAGTKVPVGTDADKHSEVCR
jgi:phospholipid/cholesterol/gamma-HCH transport system substrate-binding protein